MTISELGSLGEFVGSIAVVITLIYLTTQLRHNTRAIRAAALQALDKSITDNMAIWGSSRENALLLERGLQSSDPLPHDDETHFRMLIVPFFLSMDSNFWSHRNKLLPEELWERELTALRVWVTAPGGRRIWKTAYVSRPFREFVEAKLLKDERPA